MTEVSLLTKRASLRRRAHTTTMLCRTIVNVSRLQPELVRIDRDVCFLGRFVRIRDRRLHTFLDAERGALVRIAQDRQRLIDVLAADHVDDQPCLLRRSS